MKSEEQFFEQINFLAQKAILFEVSAAPKPGLVDRMNSGAHNDMNFLTFMESSASLGDVFLKCAKKGYEFKGENLKELLPLLRPIGIEAEKRMFKATNGINTHKGIIFSMGCISAVCGYLFREEKSEEFKAEKVCEKVTLMTEGVSENELKDLHLKEKLTNGEKLFKKHKLKGIRGEVESGFETVRKSGLRELRKLSRKENIGSNDKMIQILISLMCITEDTNIVARHNIAALEYVQKYARQIYLNGGISAPEWKTRVEKMDQTFMEKNISPGGSADLLAVTLMLGMVEGSWI